jgi:hypothetical protein
MTNQSSCRAPCQNPPLLPNPKALVALIESSVVVCTTPTYPHHPVYLFPSLPPSLDSTRPSFFYFNPFSFFHKYAPFGLISGIGPFGLHRCHWRQHNTYRRQYNWRLDVDDMAIPLPVHADVARGSAPRSIALTRLVT